jgi:hypothetical protein
MIASNCYSKGKGDKIFDNQVQIKSPHMDSFSRRKMCICVRKLQPNFLKCSLREACFILCPCPLLYIVSVKKEPGCSLFDLLM